MKHHCIHTLACTIASICLAISPSVAEPAPALDPLMAQPFRDNGVLQQKIQLPVWGTSLPGAKVTEEIAATRGVPVGQTVISPPAHTAFATPLELVHFIATLRSLSGVSRSVSSSASAPAPSSCRSARR